MLPFAAAMELMAEVAAAAVPGREIAGLRDIRLLDGDRPARATEPVSVAHRRRAADGAEEVERHDQPVESAGAPTTAREHSC